MDSVFLSAPIFFVIAFVFSMLGMGGSQLYIPILFWTGMDFKTEAIPLGMLLNLVNSSSAAITYSGSNLIAWRVAVPFAVAIVACAPIGVWLNVQLSVEPLLICFALFTATAAVLMLSGWKPQRAEMSSRGRVALGLTAGGGLGVVAGLDRARRRLVHRAALVHCGSGSQNSSRYLGRHRDVLRSVQFWRSPDFSSSASMVCLGRLCCRSVGRQPAWLAPDGAPTQVPCGQDDFWLDAAGCCSLGPHQGCCHPMTHFGISISRNLGRAVCSRPGGHS